MGLTRIVVTLRKFGSEESFTSTFLVDTGCLDSMAPSAQLRKIGIEPVRKELYELANGERKEYELGYGEMTFMGKSVPGQIIFGPDDCEPILGVITLESAGFVVDPIAERLKRVPARSLKAVPLILWPNPPSLT